MTPPSEVLAATPELVPGLAGAALRLFLAVALLAAGAWALVRWKKRAGAGKRQLRVLDRAFIARGASVTLVEVEGRRFLLGVSSDGVRLLRDLEPASAPRRTRDFEGVLAEVSSRREER